MPSKTLIIGAFGYIGSACLASGLGTYPIDYDADYDNLTREQLSEWDTIILLAGHSSVLQCIQHPQGAWKNNVTKFERLVNKIDRQKLIYASSGSVYNRCEVTDESNRYFYLTNIYDLTKYTIDQLALLSGKNVYGLRFGTVCGYSPRVREDLMINRMYSLKDTGKIQVNNTAITRPILAISDLVRAVKAIIEGEDRPGIYNLASFTKTVGEVAFEVATRYSVDIEHTPPTPAYDFTMDTSKFQDTYNFMFQADLTSILTSLENETIN